MGEKGWLRQVLSDAKADVNTWPDWMKQSGWEREPARSQVALSIREETVSAPRQLNAKESTISGR
jgi:hypothetical protein